MIELAVLVPQDIDFSILASLFSLTEIVFVVLPLLLVTNLGQGIRVGQCC